MNSVYIQKISIAVLTYLLFAMPAYGAELLLPTPTGHYSVGTKAIQLVDPQRTMFRKNSPRKWMVQGYFPTDLLSTQQYPYMPGTLERNEILNTQIWAHANPNSTISKAGPFPVIFFLHGLGNVRQSYSILCEELASHGYVVLSMDQPYVSSFVKFPNGTKVTITFHDAWNLPRDRDFRYQYYDEAMKGAIGDFKYLLDNLSRINTDYFSSQLNISKVVTMGHSFGGNVAHTFGFVDPRVKAVLDIDSKITERKINGIIGVPPNPQKKPVLFVRAMKQYQENVGDALTKIENSEIKNFNVQHSVFHDNAYFSHKIPSMGTESTFTMLWTWFFKTGPHFDSVDTDIGNLSVEEWFRELNSKLVRWLDHVLGKP